MIWDPNMRAQVFVVDACQSGYESLVENDRSLNVVFFANAGDALQALKQNAPVMWIVNVRLPDMSGADLQSILRSRGCQSPIALVGDEYQAEDEIAARCAGADMYFAKPLQQNILLSAA